MKYRIKTELNDKEILSPFVFSLEQAQTRCDSLNRQYHHAYHSPVVEHSFELKEIWQPSWQNEDVLYRLGLLYWQKI